MSGARVRSHSFTMVRVSIKCLTCDNSYTNDEDFDKHICIPKIYSCDTCKLTFKHKRQLTRHMVKKHSIERPCNWCSDNFTTSPKQMYYCDRCKANCVKECKRCHRPFTDEKYFSMISMVRSGSISPEIQMAMFSGT